MSSLTGNASRVPATSVAGPGGGSPHQQHSRRNARLLAMSPLVALLALLTIIPTLYILVVSFTNYAATNDRTSFVGLANYGALFGSGQYWATLLRTLVFVIVAVAIQLALGLGIAVVMSGVTRGGSLVRALILMPMAAAPIAMLFNWRQIFNASYGPINYLLGLLHLPQPDWFADPALALPALVLVDTWQWTPFVFIILAGGLATIPGDVYEAAAMDGAGGWKRFTTITVPLLMPYIAVAVLFRTIDALKTFDSVQVLTAGGPGSSTLMLNFSIFQQGISFLEFGRASASAVVFLIVCTVLANLLLRGLKKKEA